MCNAIAFIFGKKHNFDYSKIFNESESRFEEKKIRFAFIHCNEFDFQNRAPEYICLTFSALFHIHSSVFVQWRFV